MASRTSEPLQEEMQTKVILYVPFEELDAAGSPAHKRDGDDALESAIAFYRPCVLDRLLRKMRVIHLLRPI
jgi:hypothetical protein